MSSLTLKQILNAKHIERMFTLFSNNNIIKYVFNALYAIYIKMRVQWTYNDTRNNNYNIHGRTRSIMQYTNLQ